MSAIAGIVRWDGAPVDRSTIDAMVAAAPHRGAGGFDVWTHGSAGFARQTNLIAATAEVEEVVSDGPLAVVADARIDNLDELAKTLRLGHQGADPAPAPVLLAAYRAWGTSFPQRLLGDFALVLWDAERRTVLAARDPMGLRALYYASDDSRLLFGTEAKQVLAAPGVEARISGRAVAAHLTGSHGGGTACFFERVRLLPPGHTLHVVDGAPELRRFWTPADEEKVRYGAEDDYVEHFRELFSEAVRCRLRCPRPVGVFLSGGVDSGSVAAMAGRLLQEDPSLTPELRAFSFAFNELAACDERGVSRGIVDAYDLASTDVPADDAWPLQSGPEHAPDPDAPTTLWFYGLWNRGLALARSRGIDVVLGGDRGDLLVGESIYDHTGLFWRGRWPTLLRELRLLSRWQEEPLARVARRSLLAPLSRALWPQSAARRWLRRTRGKESHALPEAPPWVRRPFLARENLGHGGNDPGSRPGGEARRQRYAAIFDPTQMASLLESERTYARHGVGFADPFSDRRLTEFVLAIPQRVVNRPDDRKRILKQAMQGIVPPKIAKAQRKISPWPLAQRGLKEREVETVRSLLRDSIAEQRGWIDAAVALGAYESYLAGGRLPSHLWFTLTLEVWLRAHWS